MNLPTRLHLEITNRCNSPCATCIRTHSPDADRDLSLADIIALTDSLPELASVALQVNGEPLLHPELPAVVSHLSSRGVVVEFNTNGLLLGGERARALIDSGLAALNVSVETTDPQIYSQLRGVDAHAVVVRGLESFLAARGRAPASPRVSLWMTVTRRNLDQLPGLVELAGRVGAEEVYMQRLVYFDALLARSEESVHGKLTAKQRGLIARAEDLAAEKGVQLRACGHHTPLQMLEQPANNEEWRSCRRPWEGAVVMANGDVVPCCISTFTAQRSSIAMGNVHRSDWETIWNGAAYRDQRERMSEGEPPAHCQRCGGCWSL